MIYGNSTYACPSCGSPMINMGELSAECGSCNWKGNLADLIEVKASEEVDPVQLEQLAEEMMHVATYHTAPVLIGVLRKWGMMSSPTTEATVEIPKEAVEEHNQIAQEHLNTMIKTVMEAVLTSSFMCAQELADDYKKRTGRIVPIIHPLDTKVKH